MFDQLVIAGIGSMSGYDATVKERKIVDGKKKTIKGTVPFSNRTYDFSKIDGEFYWEEKSLQYNFEITADSIEELARKISRFKSWVMNVMLEELHDPFIPDYHFMATFADISVDDAEIEKATISVSFTAYPYMISNNAKSYNYDLTAGEEKIITISNNSSHRITPTFNANIPFTLKTGDFTYSVPSGETTDNYFKLDQGENEISVTATNDGQLTITFYEEVF